MKKIFVAFFLTMTSMVAHANDTYDFLVFATDNGGVEIFHVNELKLTFADGKIYVTNSLTSATLSLSEFSKMYFSNDYTHGIKVVNEKEDKDPKVEVFTVSGIRMGQYDSVADARKALGQGVYIFKQGNKTNKITIK